MPTEPGPDIEQARSDELRPDEEPRKRWTRIEQGHAVRVVAALAVVGLLVLVLAWSALSIRHRLLGAQSQMREGRSELLAGNASGAEDSFVSARDGFAAARAGAPGLVLRVTGWIPIVGRSPDAVSAIADAGSRAAGAGVTLAHAVAELPGGLTSLAPTHGGMPIERLTPLTDAVMRASGEVTSALATVERSPGSLLIGPVAEARSLAEEELVSLNGLLRSGSLLLEGLPRFLGRNGPRRYFFAAQNPAELRGTGGVLGAFSILTIEDGRFRFSPFRPIQSLPIPPLDEVPPPSAEYAANYDQFRGGERFWLAINLTPDFPTAAEAILNAYAVAEGTQLDGVIVADPFALEALLRVTGPTAIPGLKTEVDADNVVALTANEAYSLFPDPAERKKILGSVASGVFEDFMRRSQPNLRDLKTLSGAAAEGHILAFSTDPTMEQGLRGTAAGGALQTPPGDFFSVVENSAGANKVDFYQDRSIAYAVRLGAGGSAEATADVRFTNHAPTTGEPRYVIGPHPGATSEPGESSQLVNVYCGAGCRLESAYRDGTRIAVWTGSELGHPFYQDYFRTLSGETSDLRLELQLPQAWQGNGSGGVYRLTFLSQTTIRPTSLLVQVQVPEGMHIVEVSPSMQIEGDSAVWTGTPSRRLELEVRFQPSLLVRLWHGLF